MKQKQCGQEIQRSSQSGTTKNTALLRRRRWRERFGGEGSEEHGWGKCSGEHGLKRMNYLLSFVTAPLYACHRPGATQARPREQQACRLVKGGFRRTSAPGPRTAANRPIGESRIMMELCRSQKAKRAQKERSFWRPQRDRRKANDAKDFANIQGANWPKAKRFSLASCGIEDSLHFSMTASKQEDLLHLHP